MEALLINFDESEYKSKIGRLETFIQFFDNAIGVFNSFGLGKFETKDFSDLFLQTENYVFDKIVQGKSLIINGLPISKNKLRDLIEWPKGYLDLINKIQQIDRKFQATKERYYLENLKNLLDFFEFNDDDEIILKQTYYDDYKREYETYVSTEKAKKTYHFAQELLQLYEKYGVKPTSNADNGNILVQLINFSSEKYCINTHYISIVERQALGKN